MMPARTSDDPAARTGRQERCGRGRGFLALAGSNATPRISAFREDAESASPLVGSSHDPRSELAEPVHAQDDLVARLEIPPDGGVANLEQATGPDGSASDEVTRPQAGICGSAGDHRAKRVLRVRPDATARLLPVDGRGHREVIARAAPRIRQLVGCHEPRAERAREVLALGRTETDRRLLALEVARRPIVEDREAADGLLRPLLDQIDGGRV